MEFIEAFEGDNLNVWVIRLMHRYSAVNFKKFMEHGIHPGQLPVLKTVYGHEGISLRDLAMELHVKPPTVTVTVKRLEKAGMVSKKTDPEDLRVSRIYLTEKGKNSMEESLKLLNENAQILTRGFSSEEIDMLCGYFKRMTDNLVKEK